MDVWILGKRKRKNQQNREDETAPEIEKSREEAGKKSMRYQNHNDQN
jgi:hypothetical protein